MAQFNYTHYRIWTGPCAVHEIAGRLRDASYRGVFEGTEHVHFNGSPDKNEEIVKVERVLGWKTRFGDLQRV